jgi:hypothetical protein
VRSASRMEGGGAGIEFAVELVRDNIGRSDCVHGRGFGEVIDEDFGADAGHLIEHSANCS